MFLAKVFHIISQKFNAALFLVLTLTVLFLIYLEGGFFFSFLSLFLSAKRELFEAAPEVWDFRSSPPTKKTKSSEEEKAVKQKECGIWRLSWCSPQHKLLICAQRGELGAEELLGLPFHQLLQLAGSAPGLASAGGKCDETQPRTASKMQVWELESPELPWGCGAGFLMCGCRVPLESQFLHLLQHLGGTTWPKLLAYYQCLMLPLAAVTDVVSTSLTLFFWQPLLMMFLEGNPLENCLFQQPGGAAPTLSSQCCQHQVSTIISSIQHEVTPTLLPWSSSFCDYSVTPSLQLWPHRPFLVLDVKPTMRGHDLRMELFSFTCRLS